MNTPPNRMASIRDRLGSAPAGPERFLWGATARVCLGHVSTGTSLGGQVGKLAGRSVLIVARDQFAAALALIELDGIARRLIVCTPDLPSEHLPAVVAKAGVDAIVSDKELEIRNSEFKIQNSQLAVQTEWVLLTSGTTGTPKMLVHSFAGLTAPVGSGLGSGDDVVWGTFYDIRRYGGLQIFFRGVLGGRSLVLSCAHEPIGDYLKRLGAHRVTHLTETPSHWRRAIMSPSARAISPQYVRLSGEIADQ